MDFQAGERVKIRRGVFQIAGAVILLAAVAIPSGAIRFVGWHWPWEKNAEASAQCWDRSVSSLASKLAEEGTQQSVENLAKIQGLDPAQYQGLEYAATLEYQHAESVDKSVQSTNCSAQADITITKPGNVQPSMSFQVPDFHYSIFPGKNGSIVQAVLAPIALKIGTKMTDVNQLLSKKPTQEKQDTRAPASAPAAASAPTQSPASAPASTAVPSETLPTDASSGPSFDCARAFYPDEKAICASSALSALDRQLAAVYFKARAAAPDLKAFQAAQNRQILERRLCGSSEQCITAWYQQRMQELTADLGAATQ